VGVIGQQPRKIGERDVSPARVGRSGQAQHLSST
jgi:hypothetical protein